MIIAAETAKEVRQSEPDPEFNVGSPRLNPLAASAPISITEGVDSVALNWNRALAEQSGSAASELVERLVERSRRQVIKHPNSARAHTNLGIALLNSGDLVQAAQEFKKALEIEPKQYVAATSL